MTNGLYEQLITKLVSSKLDSINKDNFFIKENQIEKAEASLILSNHLAEVINKALLFFTKSDSLELQIQLSNRIIRLLRHELENEEFDDDLIMTNGRILSAVFSKIDSGIVDFEAHLKEINPYTRLTQSELFTGSNTGLSLESELKKEILSSDRIDFLVSFIKWSGIRIFEKELREFTKKGNKLRVITTSYMGATDLKAIEFLASLPNVEVKISYNTENERLHAKSYLFYRNTGFHTGYIGSSNLSRSALTSGLEWNLKVTTKEVGHIIDKFSKTFETYWQDKEFETFIEIEHREKLQKALNNEKLYERGDAAFYFEIKPYHFQQEILEKLDAERKVHKRYKNLLVAATGTGKTVISAFDFKNFRNSNPNAKLLFVAHRKEILQQARATFAGVLRDNNFGELWVDGQVPSDYSNVFASVLTLNNQVDNLKLSTSFFDFIIIDEVHHIAAKSYRPILEKFSPNVLLGLTATPERMDNENILDDFCGTIAAEIRLPEALNKKLLCPFQYFGITDSIDLRHIKWNKGKYDIAELTKVYTENDIRVGEIIKKCKDYLTDYKNVRAIGFCVSKEHAIYMAEKFYSADIKADYIVSGDGRDGLREKIKSSFRKKEINYLFVVDIFNEGVDIPEIDTVLFLRPTESLTVFLQQLGRGLRLSDNKDCLTVLDFVGNSRAEYDFEGRFRALIGKTNTSTKEELENDFPHLPLGCSIILEKKAKEIILENIKKATQLREKDLINKIINFQHHTNEELTLKNFCNFYHIPLAVIYKKKTWNRLCVLANIKEDYPNRNEKELVQAVSKKWLACNSYSYLNFILQLAKNNFNVNEKYTKENTLFLNMLYYDFWQTPRLYPTLNEAISAIGNNPVIVSEIIDALEIIIDNIAHIELDIDLAYQQPLKVHSRYTRAQILAAFGVNNFQSKTGSISGVLNIKEKNTELLFITLEKTEEKYSPTTMYNDYAKSETIFHWQSQNTTTPHSNSGRSYINQEINGKRILLFVREKETDSFNNTMSYVFLGDSKFIDSNGSQPMNINWELKEPIPHYIWKETAKMAVG
ncbi:DUF3427 domain-containing protein [Flavobacterium granuli]|uniref:Superfamily II DNA or RNA helicase n=1 Tax=Flavobacterium granuli TaxID=280093 RepID=A0A1M5JUC7_9FLAO|nr:DEAD/DEAH box helicase [Flavobacterium granuli]PRZ26064.1 superfamily II DNA or RNA helicase [Flavobacterium granuli]SHG44161.1 Superfamily II DNA or RNA helicase [Flavobacterium granuli]